MKVFPSGPNSHFVRVRRAHATATDVVRGDKPPPPPPPTPGPYERHRSAMRQQRDHIEEPSCAYDGDRWLERIGWRTFLTGTARTKVLEYVIEPRQGSPPYESKIWDGVASLIVRAEKLLSRTSHFVRVAIVQVE